MLNLLVDSAFLFENIYALITIEIEYIVLVLIFVIFTSFVIFVFKISDVDPWDVFWLIIHLLILHHFFGYGNPEQDPDDDPEKRKKKQEILKKHYTNGYNLGFKSGYDAVLHPKGTPVLYGNDQLGMPKLEFDYYVKGFSTGYNDGYNAALKIKTGGKL